MTITIERLSIWWSFIRSSPITNMFYPLVLSLHKPKRANIYFLLAYCIVFITNGIEKEVSKYIYNLFGVDTFPIIGKGERPEGASNCGTYLVYPDKPALSYGMPSGHSELGWFFSTYLILEIISNKSIKKYNHLLLLLSMLILVVYAYINSYARVYIEKCHTSGQVWIGGILGVFKGLILHTIGRVII